MNLPCGMQAAVDVIDKFDIKNSKDFANLYSSIFSTPGHSKKSGAKNKKQSFSSTVKLSPERIAEAIGILSFADKDIAAKFANDKNFRILDELKARKSEFETLLPEIQEFSYLNENPAFSGKSSFEIFMDYKKLAKKLASNGEDFKTFISNAEMFETTDALEYSSYSDAYNDFAQYFPDKKTTNAFLSKNGIKLDSSHESSTYRQNCLKILGALDKEKDREYIEKLADSNFIRNSKTELPAFLSKTGIRADLGTVVKTILDKDIQSFGEIRQIIRLYANSNGEYGEVFEHFRNTPENVGLNEYLAVLDKIQEGFASSGIPIKINNDNISAIGSEYFCNDSKISQYKIIQLADKMSQKTGGNFIASLEKAFSDESTNASPYAIAREIVNRASKNSESYKNILRELNLTLCKEDALSDGATRTEYIYALAKALPQEFVDFVNDNEWTDFAGDNKYPNMKLHAKMRLIDRFVLNEEGSIEKLYTKETEEKLKNVLKTVYTNAPLKLIKCNKKDKDRFEAQFDYGNDNKINAVFCNGGEMITIVKH